MPPVIVSARDRSGAVTIDVPVEAALLAAGDHNGATFHQHMGFRDLCLGRRSAAEVGMLDGWWAVALGMAAQEAAARGVVVDLGARDYAPPV